MAIFQPSNIIPSSFAGVGLGTVDVNKEINISWQVNGNSPMTAYRIQIYDNNSTANTVISDSGLQTLSSPFYPVDAKGNPKQFVVPTNSNWSTLGLTNGNEYKIIITQWWGDNPTLQSTTQITQWSGSVFLTRNTPELNITLNNAIFDGSADVDSAIVTFGANYSQEQGDVVNSIRWQFGLLDANQKPSSNSTIIDSDVNILDDTGFINTSVFNYTYNGLRPKNDNDNTNVYVVKCTVETQNGVQEPTDWIAFYVNYEEAISSNTLKAQCMEDDSVLVSWDKAIDIPGVLSPSGTPAINDSQLILSENQSVEWNTVDGEVMNFENPWSVVCKNTITTQPINKDANTTVNIQTTLFPTNITTTANLEYAVRIYKSETIENSLGISQFNVKSSVSNFVGGYSSLNGKGYILEYKNSQWVSTEVYERVVSLSAYLNTYPIYALTRDGEIYVKINQSNEWVATTFKLPYKDAAYKNIYASGSLIFVTSKDTIYIINGSTVTAQPITIDSDDEFIKASSYSNGYIVISKKGRYFYYNYYQSAWSEDSVAEMYLSEINDVFDFVSTSSSVFVVGDNGYAYKRETRWGTTYASTLFETNAQVVINSDGRGYCILSNNCLYYVYDKNDNYFDNENAIYYSGLKTNLVLLRSSNSGFTNSALYQINYSNLYQYSFNPNAWIKTITPSSSVYNFSYTGQSSLNQQIKIKAVSDSAVSVVIELVNPVANKVINNNFNIGKIKTVTTNDIQPLNSTVNTTYADNNYSLSIQTPILSANIESVEVSFNVAIQYEPYNWYSQYFTGDLLYLNNQIVSITSEQQDSVVRYLLNYGSYGSIYLPQQLNGNNFSLLFGITERELKILLINETNNYLINETIDYTQESISSLKLIGPQVVDYLYVQQGEITSIENFTPSWTTDTLFYASFSNLQDALQAGTLSTSGEIVNSLYRKDSNGNLTFIGDFPTNVTEIKDYWVKSGERYFYEIFYLSANSGYSTPSISNSICKRFKAYTLIEAKEDGENPNTYHVVKAWRFGNNISAGSISNNNTPNWLTNFTPYRLRQPSSRLGESGTLQALLSNYNQSENFYQDTVKMMQRLKEACSSNNTFFLKDMKGNLYMVGISAPIVQTINTKTKVQEVKVSIPWEEVGDASNVSLLQLPTDEGWQQDEVFNVVLSVDANTGLLSATYPYNYRGTTFELVANTPDGINGAYLVLTDGAVIASKKGNN